MMRTRRWLLLAVLVAAMGANIFTPQSAAAAAACSGTLFPETGFCVGGKFLAHWNANGGLAINGYPLSDEFDQVQEDGKTYRVQYFERVRLELHPENQAPYDVLRGQFGRRVLAEVKDKPTGICDRQPAVQNTNDQRYFPETGIVVRGDFWYFMQQYDLAITGYPLCAPFNEVLEDGKTYHVQYFERVRMEIHPELSAQPPGNILLGQFGRRILTNSQYQETGPGKSLPFKAGQAVLGFQIGVGADKFWYLCYMAQAPGDGVVLDGVINPRPDQISATTPCNMNNPRGARIETGNGVTREFKEGDDVFGAYIKLKDGSEHFQCRYARAPQPGFVISGVINGFPGEGDRTPACQ